jgi:predicted ArsR family transcriptional regulator
LNPQPNLPSAARSILDLLKRNGSATIRELARELHLSYEAVRQQIAALSTAGWIVGAAAAAAAGVAGAAAGRRPQRYRLSEAGEHLFPKHYDALTTELLGTLLETGGEQAVLAALERMTQTRLARWRAVLEGLSFEQKLQALRGLYEEHDAHMQLQWEGRTPLLVERNCPFLNVARSHPVICSVSVSLLAGALGLRVVRERRFQDGDGYCAFRVCVDEPTTQEHFALEPPRTPVPA